MHVDVYTTRAHTLLNRAGGSWSESCAPMSWEGGVLKAYCGLLTNDKDTLSTLDYAASCAPGSGVTNLNNELRCGVSGQAVPGK